MKYLAMVVDDDAASRFIYERVLKSLDFNVLQAGDGATAIELLSSHTPQILLLDLLLPRISGLQVLEYARKAPHLRNLQIVVITAHSEFPETHTLGHNEQFLLKPVMARTLRELIARAMQSASNTS